MFKYILELLKLKRKNIYMCVFNVYEILVIVIFLPNNLDAFINVRMLPRFCGQKYSAHNVNALKVTLVNKYLPASE